MTTALLLSWDLRPEVILLLGLLAVVYLRGWLRLRALPVAAAAQSQDQHRPLAARWRLATYWAGLLTLAVSLMSPIDVLSGQLFFMHMT